MRWKRWGTEVITLEVITLCAAKSDYLPPASLALAAGDVRAEQVRGGYNPAMSTQPGTERQEQRDLVAVDILRTALRELVAAYRFGSTATGSARLSSDVDLAVLADGRLDPIVRFDLQERLAGALHIDVDLVDLRAASTVMASQIVTTGVLLYEGDSTARHVFENFVYGRYARFNEERREILDRIAREGRVYGG